MVVITPFSHHCRWWHCIHFREKCTRCDIRCYKAICCPRDERRLSFFPLLEIRKWILLHWVFLEQRVILCLYQKKKKRESYCDLSSRSSSTRVTIFLLGPSEVIWPNPWHFLELLLKVSGWLAWDASLYHGFEAVTFDVEKDSWLELPWLDYPQRFTSSLAFSLKLVPRLHG